MPFQQNIDSARAEKIGAQGIARPALDDALARSEAALDWLRAAHANATLPLLRLPLRLSSPILAADWTALAVLSLRHGSEFPARLNIS